MTLFDRIIDIENIDTEIVQKLTPMEIDEVYHRLGYLNMFNPMHPDREYRLDLRSFEQRAVCQCLVELAVEEPGENWRKESFRWTRDSDPSPGWALPQGWSDNNCDGVWKFGQLYLIYTSERRYGCDPVWAVRKRLMKKVLCGTEKSY